MQVFRFEVYELLKKKSIYFKDFVIVPYLRRIIRFMALPYCYLYLINWKECRAGKLRVAYDLLYIFFILKYFPDNYSLCRLWEKKRSDWVYYYGSNYDPYQRRQLRKHVQPKAYEIVFEDKYICYQLCQAAGLRVPVQILWSDKSEKLVSDVKSYLETHPGKQLLIKPVGGSGGYGIMLAWQENGAVWIRERDKKLDITNFLFHGPFVVQEFLTQHPRMAKVASSSVNTIRIVTLISNDDDIVFLGAEARFGVNNDFIDNISQGGIAVGVNLGSGRLMGFGYDFYSRMYDKHPTSGFRFESIEVPMWDELLDMARRAHCHFGYVKLLGQDIAIGLKEPVLIELNTIYDNVGIEQSFGPILKNPRVLEEYGKYDLLINTKQKKLYLNLRAS